MITYTLWQLAIVLMIYLPLNEFVLRPLSMKLIPKYFIPMQVINGHGIFKQVEKALIKIYLKDKSKYHKIINEINNDYMINFSLNTEQIDKEHEKN